MNRGSEEPDPLALAAVTLHLVRLWAPARSAALFACEESGPRLVLSDLIDQGALDDARALWPNVPVELHQGAAYRGRGSRDYLAVPCLALGRVRGLLYLEIAEAVVIRPPRQLRVLADILAATLPGGETATAQSVSGEAAANQAVVAAEDGAKAANLLALLERHEWNISRVARLVSVTRATVYNRLRRVGVEPKHARPGRSRHGSRPRRSRGSGDVERAAAHETPAGTAVAERELWLGELPP